MGTRVTGWRCRRRTAAPWGVAAAAHGRSKHELELVGCCGPLHGIIWAAGREGRRRLMGVHRMACKRGREAWTRFPFLACRLLPLVLHVGHVGARPCCTADHQVPFRHSPPPPPSLFGSRCSLPLPPRLCKHHHRHRTITAPLSVGQGCCSRVGLRVEDVMSGTHRSLHDDCVRVVPASPGRCWACVMDVRDRCRMRHACAVPCGRPVWTHGAARHGQRHGQYPTMIPR